MTAALIRTERIGKRFGGLQALDDVSLELREGEVHGLIGPNGAGKTTCFNVLTGVYAPSSGRVFVGDRNVTGWPPYRMAGLGIGRTFQGVQLFKEMTVLENLAVGLHPRLKGGILDGILGTPSYRADERRVSTRAQECLDLVGLRVDLGSLARNLPYGHQRLLEIARALMSEPRALLLDEPAAGLNTEESSRLIDVIRRINGQGIAILIVDHDMTVVMTACQRITVLDYGRQIASGAPEEIQSDPRVMEAYLGKGFLRAGA